MEAKKATNLDCEPLMESMVLLRPFLDDADTKFIFVNRPGEVITENNEGTEFHSIPKLDYSHCRNLAILTAAYSKQRLDEENPELYASLPGGERITIIIPPRSSPGHIYITIRKANLKVTLDSYLYDTRHHISSITPSKPISSIEDTYPLHIHALDAYLTPFQYCAPSVADALQRISAEISNQYSKRGPSFSITSRNPSIWSLIRKHLDAPLNDVIQSYDGIYLQELLEEFRLSTIGKIRPNYRINATEWAKIKDSYRLYLYDWKNLLIPTNQLKDVQQNSEVDLILNNIEAWYQNIRFTIHSLIEPCNDRAFAKSLAGVPDECKPRDNRVSNKKYSQFYGTLNSILSFLSYLNFLKPKTEKDPLQLHTNPLPYIKTHPSQDDYCELCWRSTMRSAEFKKINDLSTDDQHIKHIWNLHKQGKNHQEIADALKLSTGIVFNKIQKMEAAILKAMNANNHFCHEHDPDPLAKSRYRADIHYKHAFQRELEALTRGNTSRFIFRFPRPDAADEQELRKTAYDQVHAGIRSLNNIDKQSRLEEIFVLHLHGNTTTEIASKLRLAKQAVNERKNKINKLLQIRQQEQYVCPISEESWEKSLESDLVQQIIALHKKGHTVAEIADNTYRFKHTIHSIYLWLKLKPNKRAAKKRNLTLVDPT